MKMADIVIDSKWKLFEAAYPGNLGLMELVKFYNVATDEEKATMDRIINEKDWDAFKALVHEVLGIRLI